MPFTRPDIKKLPFTRPTFKIMPFMRPRCTSKLVNSMVYKNVIRTKEYIRTKDIYNNIILQ